jgi:uncharacterized protein YkwD
VALIVFVCALCAVVAVMRSPNAQGATRAELRLLGVVNDARAAHGLRRLRLGWTIQNGAHDWARYLLRYDTFRHARLPSGTAENIGWLSCRDNWARTLTRWWLESYVHRINLLNPRFTRIGVGVASGRWSGWSCATIGVTRFR